jgi:hypothetical protein
MAANSISEKKPHLGVGELVPRLGFVQFFHIKKDAHQLKSNRAVILKHEG